MDSLAKLKKFFWFFVKLGIAGGIVGYLVARNPAEIAAGFRSFNYKWLLPALVVYGSHMLVCSWRWFRLTRMLHVELSPFEALSLTFQGYFFSLVIPGGAVGGDVVKIGVLSKRSRAGSRMEGALTILMDRIIGMIALFTLSLALLIPACPLLMKVELPQLALSDATRELGILALAGLCVAGLGASCVIFFHRWIEKVPPFGALMHWGDRASHGMVTRMTAATDTYAKQWTGLTFLTIVSIFFVHLMTVAAYGCLMAGLGLPIPVLTLIAAVTIGNIAGLIPLFPGGIGGRDVVTITILVAGGISAGDAKTAQLLYTGMVLLFNVVGGLFFLLDPGRKHTETILKDEMEASGE